VIREIIEPGHCWNGNIINIDGNELKFLKKHKNPSRGYSQTVPYLLVHHVLNMLQTISQCDILIL
jgi:hypothetical protein